MALSMRKAVLVALLVAAFLSAGSLSHFTSALPALVSQQSAVLTTIRVPANLVVVRPQKSSLCSSGTVRIHRLEGTAPECFSARKLVWLALVKTASRTKTFLSEDFDSSCCRAPPEITSSRS
jgi:hypothetical protein